MSHMLSHVTMHTLHVTIMALKQEKKINNSLASNESREH
jgi:hypothetical protein